MADKQNLGQQGGMHEGQDRGSQQSPGRNPQDDRSTGGRVGDGRHDRENKRGFDPSEGDQNEETRR